MQYGISESFPFQVEAAARTCRAVRQRQTLSALLLAYGITGDWSKIAVIDTEHGRAKFYADRSDLGTGAFLYQEMCAPYSPDKYKQMVSEGAAAVGADGVVIVDSFSHAWDNEGGVLDIKSNIAKQANRNDYTAWNEAGQIQNNLVNAILSAPCHTIITLRTKMAYAMEENERGKMVPVKLGLAPVQRENVEYEFDIVLNISANHQAMVSKDTTFWMAGQVSSRRSLAHRFVTGSITASNRKSVQTAA